MNKAYWKNKIVLITGADGFVGSHFFLELQNEGVKVIGSVLKKEKNSRLKKGLVKLDVLDRKNLSDICKSKKINLIIHCAALDGNSEFKKKNSARIINENIQMALNILDTVKENKIRELVLISSAEIYAYSAKSPIKEEEDYLRHLPDLSSGYVASKVKAEILARLYSSKFGLKIMLPRPTNIYGPGDKIESGANRVIPNMISSILSDKNVDIWGNGNQVRGFVYIEDFIRAIMCLLEKKEYSPVNIATDESISIKNLAKLIAKISSRKIKLVFDKNKPIGVNRRILDVQKLNSLIDFKPLSLREGLERTIKQYDSR